MSLKNRIVITGMGAITPLGNDVETLWDNILKGRSGIGKIEAFDASELPVQIAGEVKDFDPEAYMPKKLAKEMDRFMQFAYASCDEALKDAGLVPDENGDYPISNKRIGIVFGSVFSGTDEVESTQDALSTGKASRVGPRFITKMIGNIAAAQIAINKGLMGPSITVSTACSSGLDAINVGAMLIETDKADAVICVGAEAANTPLVIKGLSAIHALSKRNDDPEGASRPFDVSRDGFVMSEGSGTIIIEKEESARKRNASCHAELIGYANGTDGYHVTSPDPDGKGAVLVMSQAIEEAGIDLSEVDYINAHGTSTPKGDVIEVDAIKQLFKEHSKELAVSSTKGAHGHLMGAGGVVETIICVKAVEDGMLPPTINLKEPDEAFGLDFVPNVARKKDIKIAMCNAFGFGGQNAAVIVKKS